MHKSLKQVDELLEAGRADIAIGMLQELLRSADLDFSMRSFILAKLGMAFVDVGLIGDGQAALEEMINGDVLGLLDNDPIILLEAFRSLSDAYFNNNRIDLLEALLEKIDLLSSEEEIPFIAPLKLEIEGLKATLLQEYNRARLNLVKAARIYDEQSFTQQAFHVLLTAAEFDVLSGQNAIALEMIQDAEKLLTEDTSRKAKARYRIVKGLVNIHSGKLTEACQSLSAAMGLVSSEFPNPAMLGSVFLISADLAFNKGNQLQAKKYLDLAVAELRDVRNLLYQYYVIILQIKIFYELGEFDQCAQLGKQMIETFKEGAPFASFFWSLTTYTILALSELKDRKELDSFLRKVDELVDREEDDALCERHLAEGIIELVNGNFTKAQKELTEAVGKADLKQMFETRILSMYFLAMIFINLGKQDPENYDKARQIIKEIIELSTITGMQLFVVKARMLEALILTKTGKISSYEEMIEHLVEGFIERSEKDKNFFQAMVTSSKEALGDAISQSEIYVSLISKLIERKTDMRDLLDIVNNITNEELRENVITELKNKFPHLDFFSE